jgi:hypothetical protein
MITRDDWLKALADANAFTRWLCSMCGEYKQDSEFCHRRNGRRSNDRCKKCNVAHVRAWAKANPGRQAARATAWNKANKERRAAICRAYYAKNRERILERQRKQRSVAA